MNLASSNHPKLFMMLGVPGAGKSFFARQYTKAENIALLDADRLRFELFEEPQFSQDEDRIVGNLLDYMSEQFLSAGISVLIDGLNSTRIRRHALRETARKFHAKPLVVWVQTDAVTAFERASNRDRRQLDDKYSHALNNDQFKTQALKVKQPQGEDYVVISGKHLFTNQMHAVNRKVEIIDKESAQNPVKKVALGGRVDLNRRKSRLI